MTPERWQRIKSILDALEPIPPADRAAALERLTADDPSLRGEVEPFLESGDEASYFHGVIGAQAASLQEAPPQQERFGRYRTIRRIGQGGMGSVYEAVRVDDFHKTVALKVIRQGLDSDYARARFLQERQMLATLEHPNIARLIDGGETEQGSPYLVLEYVDGRPLTDYCMAMSREKRLALFLKICDAVEHAHRNLVVHRDLKPGNILVTAAGEPKLLDFGIAKLLDAQSPQTQTGFAALTPEYASPEQVLGGPITTSSDVYSLGVILYQLLTDRKPYTLETANALEMERVICRQAPAAPGLGDELDHILLMALRKEPERRYGSVEKFAEDIERYMHDRPVSARPDTLRYRTKKYLRRNWWQLAAVAAVIASLGLGLAFSVAGERRADRRFQQVRQLANRFLFEFHDEIANTPGTVKARAMVVSTALEYLNSLSSESAGDPGLQWEMAVAYAKVAAAQGSTTSPSLGRPREAMASYETGLALARQVADSGGLDENRRIALVDMLCRAQIHLRGLGENDAGARIGREAVARSSGLPGMTQRQALNELSITLLRLGDIAGSVNSRVRTIAVVRELVRSKPSFEIKQELGSSLVNMGYAQAGLTQFNEAVTAAKEGLALLEGLAQERPGDLKLKRRIFYGHFYLGAALGANDRPSLGRTAEAVEQYRIATAIIDSIAAADAHDKASRYDAGLLRIMLGWLLIEQGNASLGIRHSQEAIQLLDGTGTAETRALARIAAAEGHRKLKQFLQAEQLLNEARALYNVKGTEGDAYLQLSWAQLEAERGNRQAAGQYVAAAIESGELRYAKAPTPQMAWNLARALEFAAKTEPARRERIAALWADQNRRFPGQPYIEQKMRDAQAAKISDKNR